MPILLNDYQDLLSNILTSDVYMAEHGVVFTAENKLDIADIVNNNLRNLGINGTILTPDLKFQGFADTGHISYSIEQLIIQISEFTTINRARTNPCTAQNAALRACAVLIQNLGNAITIKTIKTTEKNGFLVVNAILSTNIITISPQPLTDVEGEEVK